jgi:hypothetical protein
VLNLKFTTDSVVKAYNKIKDDEAYPIGRFTAMSILLGFGSFYEKSDLVYNHCDPDLGGEVSKQTFTNYITDTLFAAIEVIPIIAIGKGEN